MFKFQILNFALFLKLSIPAQAQDLKLLDWNPESQMRVHRTEVRFPKYPVIDIHNRLGALEQMQTYLNEMDKAGVSIAISLDGYSKNDFYKEHLKKSQALSKNCSSR